MNKVRKKCGSCGRTFVVPIEREDCEGGRRIGRMPSCCGTLSLYSGDSDDAALNLIAIAKEVVSRWETGDLAAAVRMLDEAAEDLETWIAEAPQTPQQMGWVGKDGQP